MSAERGVEGTFMLALEVMYRLGVDPSEHVDVATTLASRIDAAVLAMGRDVLTEHGLPIQPGEGKHVLARTVSSSPWGPHQAYCVCSARSGQRHTAADAENEIATHIAAAAAAAPTQES